MTIPMDNTLGNSSRERAQRLYKKNVELENRCRKAAQARIPSDPNAWQRMRENYESILLEDHAFSEQHDIEYALWQLHHRRIEELRAHYNAAIASAAQNGKGPRPGPDRITKIRTQFKTFLSEATGFYHDLMVKIRAKYGLSMGYLSDDPENDIALSKDGSKSVDVKKGLISCHRCFIYLGDLARYKGLYGEGDSKDRDFAAASSYYIQASSLWPSNGNPHHQLAILASYAGDELLAVYRYFRSLAVENPFTTARDNLIIAFEKNRQSYGLLLGECKTTTAKKAPVRMAASKGRGKGEPRFPLKDRKAESSLAEEKVSSIPETFKTFNTRFVRLNGILFTRTSLETFEEVLSTARSDFLRLLSSGPDEVFSFGSDAAECALVIIRLIAILIFTVHNVNKETENQSYAEILQRSVVLQNAFTATFEFLALILDRCFQLNDPSKSFLLPGIMIFVEWLACCQDIAFSSELEEKPSAARSLFWKHCVLFLNKLLLSGSELVNTNVDETCFFNMSSYDEGETANRLALPEDMELRGFIPLLPAQLILDFSRKHYFGGDGMNKEKKVRIQRIIAAGKALANVVRDGQPGIYFDKRLSEFVFGIEPQIFDDFTLSSSVENPTIHGVVHENHIGSGTQFRVLQPKAESYEVEDEDEVIVFKPSVTEKHADDFSLGLTSSDATRHGVNAVTFGSNASSVTMLDEGFVSATPTSFVNMTSQYLQPIEPNTAKWLVEDQGFIEKGLANLNVLGKSFPPKPELEEHFGVMQPTALSVPIPQSIHLGVYNGYSAQLPETSVPSKFDSIMTSGAGTDIMSMKPSSIKSTGSKQSPVSRPIRHVGPPPGFSSSPHKLVDKLPSSLNSINGNPALDDYSWLDGYQFPSSAYGNGFNNSIGQLVQPYNSISKSNSSLGMVSFPFPGKQVSAAQIQMENQNKWHDYQFPEHLKLCQQPQLQQLKEGKEQSAVLPQQYQGQSLWEGRFFV